MNDLRAQFVAESSREQQLQILRRQMDQVDNAIGHVTRGLRVLNMEYEELRELILIVELQQFRKDISDE